VTKSGEPKVVSRQLKVQKLQASGISQRRLLRLCHLLNTRRQQRQNEQEKQQESSSSNNQQELLKNSEVSIMAKSFPDLTGDGKTTQADILKGRGVFKKGGSTNFIQKAIKKPGALRKQLGAKPGKPIPAKKLAAAAKAPGKLGQRARFAQTLKKMK
jgi:hypothetical protein